MLLSYNVFGMASFTGSALTVYLSCFDDNGKMYKVVRTKEAQAPTPFVMSLACNLETKDKRLLFKVGFLDNPPGAEEAAKTIGAPAFVNECAEELRSLLPHR